MSFDPNTINLVKPTDKALIGTLINDDAFLVFRGDSNSFTTYRFNYQSLVALIQTFIPDITVIDSLSSISTLNALSAAQGTVLKGLVDDLISTVSTKLDASAYNNYFKGTFTSLVALQTALPTGSVGEYATVDTSGENSVLYIWDATENDWVMSISISSYNTDTIMEGSTNLYFTNQRVLDVFTGVLTDSLTSTSTTTALTANNGKLLKDALDLLTTEVGNKLDTSAFNEHYRGTYTTLGALQTAIATGDAGNYALVDSGIGNDAVYYIWDAEDGWVSGGTTTASTTNTVTEGSTNLYFTDARVRNTLLTGLSLATNAAISAADSVLGALGKLQKQITDILTNQRYTFNEQSTTTCTIASADITSNGRVIIICANASAISGSLNTPSSYGATVGDSFNIRQGGLGAITLTATGGAVLTGTATTTAQHETKTLIAQAANTWLVVGG